MDSWPIFPNVHIRRVNTRSTPSFDLFGLTLGGLTLIDRMPSVKNAINALSIYAAPKRVGHEETIPTFVQLGMEINFPLPILDTEEAPADAHQVILYGGFVAPEIL